jgi:hypothetical protein
MPVFVPRFEQPIEYMILVDPRPDGPSLGFYRDKPIAAAVVDYFGRRYVYSGVATRRRDGQYDVGGLSKEERLVEPGLIYRFDPDAGRKVPASPAPSTYIPRI